jgi:CBS domain containing-hemolysin-like protein
MTPLVWLVEWVTSPITRGRPFPTTNEAEIKMLTQIGQQEGIIERDESEMIHRVFLLNDVTAADLMTPRVSTTSILAENTLHEAQNDIVASPHSRIVITGESPDDVYGIALKSELLTAIVAGKGTAPVADFIRDVQFIPPSVSADRLLQAFRRSRQHLAIVIDEFGGVAGVVTLEDVLETLTGDIVDETDRIVDLRAAARRKGRATLNNDEPTEPGASPSQ